MLIIGAKGFAKELLQVLLDRAYNKKISFYDDINFESIELFNEYPILKSLSEAKKHFDEENAFFALGLGNSKLRSLIVKKFESIGGNLCSLISPNTSIGTIDVKIGNGATILSDVVVSNSVKIGQCSLIYYGVVITHDCNIGNYVELSPRVTLLGNVTIGDFTHLGAGAIVLPNITIGKNVTVGAGAVVCKNLPDNCVAVGVPAKIIKNISLEAV